MVDGHTFYRRVDKAGILGIIKNFRDLIYLEMEVLAKNWLCFIVILLIYNTFYNALTARAQGTNTSITDYILYKDLLNNLLVDYDPFLRPRRLIADVVDVNVSFAPINILQFDVTGQAILMSGYFTATWVDELITWKPTDYNNISVVKLQLLKVWFPRLVIGNVSWR